MNTDNRTAVYSVEYQEQGNFGYADADTVDRDGIEAAWADQGDDPADIISVGNEPLYARNSDGTVDWVGYDIRGQKGHTR